jgi:hypothetical protein
MSTDFERDVSAALHRAADQLPAPGLDLGAIRRGGRRRRVMAMTMTPLATAAVAAAVIGLVQLLAAPSRSPYPPTIGPGFRIATHSTMSPAVTRSPATTQAGGPALANIRSFYGGYLTAQLGGQAALDAFIRAHAASWYAPILEAEPQPGSPPDCAPDNAILYYGTAGQAGGQAIIVVSSANPRAPVSYGVVTADPGTGMITGIACAIIDSQVTAAASGHAASALYTSWLTLRRQGESPPEAVANILRSGTNTGYGPESGSPYLEDLQAAASRQQLTYDPLLCTPAGLPGVSVTAATVVANGSAGVVVLKPGTGQPIVVVVVLGAQGFTVADVACHQP